MAIRRVALALAGLALATGCSSGKPPSGAALFVLTNDTAKTATITDCPGHADVSCDALSSGVEVVPGTSTRLPLSGHTAPDIAVVRGVWPSPRCFVVPPSVPGEQPHLTYAVLSQAQSEACPFPTSGGARPIVRRSRSG